MIFKSFRDVFEFVKFILKILIFEKYVNKIIFLKNV